MPRRERRHPDVVRPEIHSDILVVLDDALSCYVKHDCWKEDGYTLAEVEAAQVRVAEIISLWRRGLEKEQQRGS